MARRARVVAVAAACVAVVSAFVAPAAVSSSANGRATLATLETGVLEQLNAIRRAHGLVPLRLNARLGEAAAQHSQEMGADGYFAHESVNGTLFWKRIARFYPSSRYGYWSVGENLLWSSPTVDPKGALQLWMNSPEHRHNILTAKWREIGISAVHFDSASGTYRGLPVTIITTDFGIRR